MRKPLTQLDITPFTAEREWSVEDIPVLTASVELPQPLDRKDRTARRIHRYYQLQCRAFLQYCEGWLLPQAAAEYRSALAASGPLPQFRAELGYRVTYSQGGLWSLYTQSREVTLPGRTLLQRRGDTWDLGAGYPAALEDFFPRRSGWRRQLLALAEADIQRQLDAGTARYHEDWRRALRRSFNSQNYYLTDDGLVFFYPMHTIAPGMEGIPAFLVPYGTAGLQGPTEPPQV